MPFSFKLFTAIFCYVVTTASCGAAAISDLEVAFRQPPDSARPGVYWYFMDGNLNGPEMIKDLDSMKAAGIGNLIFLEVDVGVPRGSVKFMSDEWQGLFANAVHHAENLGIDITLGAGPGWTGSGGPWVTADHSMQHLDFSSVDARGPGKFSQTLPLPAQRHTPWHNMMSPFYEDVMVVAFPKCEPSIADINEKALYERNPFSSMPGVKPYLPAPAEFPQTKAIDPAKIINLTQNLQSDGTLKWDIPPGEWTVMRMGRRSTGASTRPAPAAGVGFDHDKFDPAALDDHFDHYYGKLLAKVGPRAKRHGWTTIHLDSWEMGAQNWTPKFRAEFQKRRGYDPYPYLITFSGRAVGSMKVSERFLWDMRLTAQELVLENYAGHLKGLGHNHGFELSIEPYDMNPTADLDLGAVADVPMCEFWSAGMGFDSSFSCIEATSIGHTMGHSIVSAEAFTAAPGEAWQQFPGSMKNQGDWAFCMGINRFVFHTFAHKPLGEEYRPGMTMGPYDVHWDRGQTWWPMVKDYHRYVTRCSDMLRQGVTVSDILYLTPEGAPQVFRPPASALNGSGPLADKKGYGFDGCSPNILMARAEVKDGNLVFPGGSSYRMLVLPRFATMTPALLRKITELIEAGALVYGAPPVASPSLSGYPECDKELRKLAVALWGEKTSSIRQLGKGRILLDPSANFRENEEMSEPSLLPRIGNWIWLDQVNPAASAAVGDVQFRYRWDVSDLQSLKKVRIEATADNSFKLSVNNTQLLAGNNFHTIYSTDVLSALRPGKNIITVVATNDGPGLNPAGFIAAMRLTKADGTQAVVGSDATWEARATGTDWSAAKSLGSGSMAPWLLKPDATAPAELYPDYATTAAVLEGMSVPPDFQSDGPVRHAHRQTDTAELYFIANTTAQSAKTNCTFRVRDGAPQLWDPLTAKIRDLPRFARHGDTISLPIDFEPYQSFFIVFPRGAKPAAASLATATNFPTLTTAATLDGPWDVALDPKWGGPEKVTFDQLQDWTSNTDPGIKYYSGIATYRKRFVLPAPSEKRIYLDLGTVHDIAKVSLNGKDLGTVWCAPWRVEISAVMKTGENQLAIEVANRWPNRLFGDQQAPDKDVRTVKWSSGLLAGAEYKTGRYTFTTTQGPGKTFPSGLLGPVRILSSEEKR